MKTFINSKVMTQEDKKLLLADLCARLPYDTIVYYKTDGWESQYDTLSPQVIDNMVHRSDTIVKLYLRPMSSMTEEEMAEYELLSNHCIATSIGFIHLEAAPLIDWLNAHHFDYKGLIEKGLALKAPKDIYKRDDYGTDR